MSRQINIVAQNVSGDHSLLCDLLLAVANQDSRSRVSVILRRAVEDIRDENLRRPLPSRFERAIMNPKRDEHGNIWIELQGEKLDLEPLAAVNIMRAWAKVIGGAYVRGKQG